MNNSHRIARMISKGGKRKELLFGMGLQYFDYTFLSKVPLTNAYFINYTPLLL